MSRCALAGFLAKRFIVVWGVKPFKALWAPFVNEGRGRAKFSIQYLGLEFLTHRQGRPQSPPHSFVMQPLQGHHRITGLVSGQHSHLEAVSQILLQFLKAFASLWQSVAGARNSLVADPRNNPVSRFGFGWRVNLGLSHFLKRYHPVVSSSIRRFQLPGV